MSETSDTNDGLNTAYRVLARKYRPQTFEDLIGQDAMVTTLTNAFASGRIAQAYMLTGVRGIGKTTTARLIARALNYETEDGEDTGPSVDLSAKGKHCDAILESRHIDVIEMDAASHTGVDNVREINDAVKYKPANARYKVYIIDEVHMLSTAAFNALLKTLEEPPPHVKFIFATTEIRKVPVTVLSRCQRFDLRRLDVDLLCEHFANVSKQENIEVEQDALRMIARAAEGSVRDGLSLLDQAIAYGTDKVLAADVQSMLGLSDKARIIDLFDMVMRGDANAALKELEAQYNLGADPETILADLAGFVHWVTKLKVSPTLADSTAVSQEEKTKGLEFAEKLAMPVLARTWQMLLKGTGEVRMSPNAMMAAEMLLVRLVYAADMPNPADLAAVLKGADSKPATNISAPAADNQASSSGAVAGPGATAPSQPRDMPSSDQSPPVTHAPTMAAVQRDIYPGDTNADIGQASPQDNTPDRFNSFDELVKYIDDKRDVMLARQLKHNVLPVSLGVGQIELSLLPDAPTSLANDLMRRLKAWTGKTWIVSIANAPAGGQTIAEQKREQHNDLLRKAREDENVQAVLSAFPGAEIVEVRDLTATPQQDVENDGAETADMSDESDPMSD